KGVQAPRPGVAHHLGRVGFAVEFLGIRGRVHGRLPREVAVRRWLAALAALAPLAAQTAPQREAREIFEQLIAINTTDGSGHNTRAAEAMAVRFREAGYPAADVQTLGPAPRKGNLVVRLRGTGAGRPILFIAHLDVVEALRPDWTFDPFKLTENGGYFYG